MAVVITALPCWVVASCWGGGQGIFNHSQFFGSQFIIFVKRKVFIEINNLYDFCKSVSKSCFFSRAFFAPKGIFWRRITQC